MGRTKGSGNGSIWQTKTGWRGQISLDGERYSVSGKTHKEVVNKMDDLRVKYKMNNLVKRNDITLQEWVEHWLEKKVRPKLTDQSYDRLEGQFKYHIFPAIGNVKLQDLSKDLLEQTYAEVFQEKGKDGRKYKEKAYSHTTVNGISVQLKKCLAYAVEEGKLANNPHDGVELHKLRPPKKVDSYTSADQRIIMEGTKERKLCDRVYYWLIGTGMRFGEAVALTWDDVNLKTGEVNITKTGVNISGSMIIQEHTKTKTGDRKIIVGKNIIEWLKWHKDSIDQEANWRNLVFPNSRMNIINSSNAIIRWKRCCAEMGIEYKGIHALRHTWATRALEYGIDVKTVSAMLGHKNVITTMNIYQDVLDSQKQKCANIMDDLFR